MVDFIKETVNYCQNALPINILSSSPMYLELKCRKDDQDSKDAELSSSLEITSSGAFQHVLCSTQFLATSKNRGAFHQINWQGNHLGDSHGLAV